APLRLCVKIGIRRRGAEIQRFAEAKRQRSRAFLCVFLYASASLCQDWDSTQRRRDTEVRRGNMTTKQGFSLRVSLRPCVSASRLGFDAEAQRYRGSQREHDNEAGLFSAFFSAPLRLCVKIANFQADSSISLPSAEGSLMRSLSP